MDFPKTPPRNSPPRAFVTPDRRISDASTYYSAFSSPVASRAVSMISASGWTSGLGPRQSSTSGLFTISERDTVQMPSIPRSGSTRSISSVQTVIRTSPSSRRNLYSMVRQELDYSAYISDTEDESSTNGDTGGHQSVRVSNVRNSTISADTTWTDATVDSQVTVRPRGVKQQVGSWNEERMGNPDDENQQREPQAVANASRYESFGYMETPSDVVRPTRAHLRPNTPYVHTTFDAILLDPPEQDESIRALPTLADIRHHKSFSNTGKYSLAHEREAFWKRMTNYIVLFLCSCSKPSVPEEDEEVTTAPRPINHQIALKGMPYPIIRPSNSGTSTPETSPQIRDSHASSIRSAQSNAHGSVMNTEDSPTRVADEGEIQQKRRNRQGVVFQIVPLELQQFARSGSSASRSSSSQPASTPSDESFQMLSDDDAKWSFPPTPRKMNPNKFSQAHLSEEEDDDPTSPFILEYFAGPKINVIDIITAGTQPGEPRIPFKATVGPNGGTSFPHPAPPTSAYIRHINMLRVPSNSIHSSSIYEQGLPQGSMMSQTTGYGTFLASTSGGSKACFITNITNFGVDSKVSPLIPQRGSYGSKTFDVIKPEVSIKPVALDRVPGAFRKRGINKSHGDGISEAAAIRDQCRRGRESMGILWGGFGRARKQRAVGGFVSDCDDSD